MRILRTIAAVALVGLVAACATPEERAANAKQKSYEAQEDVAKRRLELVDQYQDCIEEAGGDKGKIEACDTYLRAAEALQ